MADFASLDEVNIRLAEIQGELWDLADDDFEARYALQLEQDRLRSEVRRSIDPDELRPTTEIASELEARKAALARARDSMLNSAAMAGGDGTGAGSYDGPGDGIKLNSGIRNASGTDALIERIARLETLLAERDALTR